MSKLKASARSSVFDGVIIIEQVDIASVTILVRPEGYVRVIRSQLMPMRTDDERLKFELLADMDEWMREEAIKLLTE